MGRSRRRSIVFFTVLGIVLMALAVALNIGWIVINWRTGVMLVLGILFFALLIAGLALNTIFLIREIRRNEQHDAFINSVTHELKTPIASIRLYLQTLEAREPDPAKRREFYKIMLADSDRLLGTVEQVLQASRTGSARRVSQKTRINLTDLVRECIGLARVRHHLADEAIEFTEVAVPAVQGDPEELKAAVSNLLDNAVKYSTGGVRVRVQLAQSEAEKVIIRVRDEGVGIPATELKQIFKRFYRIPGSITQRVKGTGLGLFLVYSIARRHGGRAYAESAGAGAGSTFTLELPIAPPLAAEPQLARSAT
ncbi:MAG: HAMP domain-containing sensor histidine kinase [Acidobacteria bacterium]|nr:HAMP domain-containing sensor histidine kinase [Acidobacteriota bacterium]